MKKSICSLVAGLLLSGSSALAADVKDMKILAPKPVGPGVVAMQYDTDSDGYTDLIMTYGIIGVNGKQPVYKLLYIHEDKNRDKVFSQDEKTYDYKDINI